MHIIKLVFVLEILKGKTLIQIMAVPIFQSEVMIHTSILPLELIQDF